jgi:hypothetical protein
MLQATVYLSMRLKAISLASGSMSFHLGRFSGALHAVPAFRPGREGALGGADGEKVARSLALCDNPYHLDPPGIAASTTAEWQNPRRGVGMANLLIKLCRQQFWLACLSASWRKPLFASSAEAIAFFRATVDGDQATLCLPRALFAAKTSGAFAADGVILIGVFLPARSMHAWVIEGGALADPQDDQWINYQPVAALA